MSQEAETEAPSSPLPSENAVTLTAPEADTEKVSPDPDDPDDVLSRLTEADTKKTTDEPADKADTPPEKAADAPVAEELDHTQPLSEEELKAMPEKSRERTKARIEKLLEERKNDRPLADFAANVIKSASEKGVRYADLSTGIELMIGFLAGDKSADARLVKALRDTGVIPAETAPARADLSPIRSAVNRLAKVDYSISEETASEILKVIDSIEKAAAPAAPPPEKKEPQEKPVEAPQKNPAAEYQTRVMQQVQANIAKTEAKYQAQHPADWKEIRAKAYAKAAEWEKAMPPEEVGDVTMWNARLVEAIHTVVSERSAKSSSTRPLPALRSTQPPPTGKKPAKGTPEYEDAIMDGLIDPDNE